MSLKFEYVVIFKCQFACFAPNSFFPNNSFVCLFFCWSMQSKYQKESANNNAVTLCNKQNEQKLNIVSTTEFKQNVCWTKLLLCLWWYWIFQAVSLGRLTDRFWFITYSWLVVTTRVNLQNWKCSLWLATDGSHSQIKCSYIEQCHTLKKKLSPPWKEMLSWLSKTCGGMLSEWTFFFFVWTEKKMLLMLTE